MNVTGNLKLKLTGHVRDIFQLAQTDGWIGLLALIRQELES